MSGSHWAREVLTVHIVGVSQSDGVVADDAYLEQLFGCVRATGAIVRVREPVDPRDAGVGRGEEGVFALVVACRVFFSGLKRVPNANKHSEEDDGEQQLHNEAARAALPEYEVLARERFEVLPLAHVKKLY